MSATQDEELAASLAAAGLNDQTAEETKMPPASNADTAATTTEAPAITPDDADEDEFGESVDLPPLEPKKKKKKQKKKKPGSKRGLVSLISPVPGLELLGFQTDHYLRANQLASRTFSQMHP